MFKENTKSKQNNQKFSNLLDNYDYSPPKKGEFFDAEVMLIEEDRILVDLGTKIDGVVTPKEMKNTDEDLISDLKIGDSIPVFVKSPPTMLRKTRVSIQKGAEKGAWDKAQDLYENNAVTELTVSGKNKGGLLVKLDRLEGFVPTSQVPVAARFRNRSKRDQIKQELVGEEILLKVIDVNPKRNKLIFSMRDNGDAIAEERLERLNIGDVVNGIVVSIEDYGAFINLYGIDGLLHISEIDWEHVEDVEDVLSIGEKIEVEILDIDYDAKQVKLSRKNLLPTPGMEELR
jgi:ribosomal protein S1